MTLENLQLLLQDFPKELLACPIYLETPVQMIFDNRFFTVVTPSKKKPQQTVGDLLFELEDRLPKEVSEPLDTSNLDGTHVVTV